MENDRKFRALAIAAICVAVVGVSVAYAALQTTLSIDGTATVGTLESAWNIHWANVQQGAKDSTINYTQAPTISSSNDEEITWAATFTAPNTSLTFTANIVNEGTLNAKLTDVTYYIDITTGSEEFNDKFDYTVTVDGTDITSKKGKILGAGTSKTVMVTVKLKDMDNATFATLANKSVSFKLIPVFVQAADGEYVTGSEL